MSYRYQELKQRHREERNKYCNNLSVRVHRALSWLDKAEQMDDLDSTFIFYWIAFNAAYAQEYRVDTELTRQQKFFDRLLQHDHKNELYQILWQSYSDLVKRILENEYILSAFWGYQAHLISEDEWKNIRDEENQKANEALSCLNTAGVLDIVFRRLYTLRNQMIHGGATYNSSANRTQLEDCTELLSSMVPTIIKIMMDGGNQLWGEPAYPLIRA